MKTLNMNGGIHIIRFLGTMINMKSFVKLDAENIQKFLKELDTPKNKKS